MNELRFRSCDSADLKRVQVFVDELYSEDPNIGHVRVDISLTWKEFQRCPEKGQLVVFEQSGQLAGYAILIFFWSNEYSGDLIEIDELFIDTAFRGQGVGTKFFAWLREHFPKCVGWTLQVAHTNRASQLYERLGFKTSRNMHMIRTFVEHPAAVH